MNFRTSTKLQFTKQIKTISFIRTFKCFDPQSNYKNLSDCPLTICVKNRLEGYDNYCEKWSNREKFLCDYTGNQCNNLK